LGGGGWEELAPQEGEVSMALLFHLGGCERSERQCSFQLGALFILALVVASMLFAQQAFGQAAAQATVAWNPVTGQVAGYDVYYGVSSGNYTATLNAGNNTSTTLQNLSAQTYYIAITAYNSSNDQSGFSPELVIDALTASAGSGGTISPSGTFFQSQGASQTFTITPSAGYTTASVLVDGTSVGAVASYTFSNLTTNHTISATFTNTVGVTSYTIKASAGANGTISPSGTLTVNYDGSQTYTITPASSSYQVANVLVDGASVGAVSSYTFTKVTANHTIAATFESISSYTVSAIVQGSGSISPSGTVSVAAGTNEAFIITPAAHHRILDVKVDNASIGPVSSYTFANITANHTIAVTFASHDRLHIRSTARGDGSIRPSGMVSVAAGTNKAFVITPAAHHRLVDVLVDGISTGAASSGGSISAASTYSFADVYTNHTIEAIFSTIPPPVADAGPDQDLINGSTVTLNGSNSTDSVCGIASYEWTQVAGPKVVLSNRWAPICTFAAPNVTSANVFTFVLKVTNNAGITESNSCLVNVAATDKAPSANAGADGIVQPHTIVSLNGSGSSDPDDGIASYRWVQIRGPRATVHGAETADASFVASHPGPLGASLIFQLQVTDHFGLTTRDQCTVNVIRAHLPPVASAGPGQTAAKLSPVSLDGSGSFDPDGSPVAYRWKQIRGVPVTLSDPTAQNPAFIAPSVSGAQSPDLLFMLTATSPSGLSSTAKCTVTAQ